MAQILKCTHEILEEKNNIKNKETKNYRQRQYIIKKY